MKRFSSSQVAKMLGLTDASLSRYIKAGKVSAPPETMAGAMRMRLWSEAEIEQLRKALPNIPDGRKTRHQQENKEKKQTKTKQKSKP